MAARQEVTFVIRARDLTRRVFGRLRRSIGSLRVQLGTLIAGGAIGALAREATTAATEIQAVADQLGISAEEAQALRVIAQDINVPFGSLANNVQRVGRNFGSALRGSGALQEAFEEAGIALDPSQFQSSLDIFLATVDAAKNLGIESARVQSNLATIADSEGLNAIQRLIRRGGNLRIEIDDLGAQLRPAEEIAQTARDEAEIRRELLQLQREFAGELRVLLPALLELTRSLNQVVGLVNDLRGGGEAGDRALTEISRRGSQLLPVVGPALRSATLRSGLGAGIFNVQQDIVQLWQRIANGIDRMTDDPNRGVFRIGD